MPEIGEIKSGTELGFKQRSKYIYLACAMCGKPRWVTIIRSKKPYFNNYCMENGCQQRARAFKQHAKDILYWDGKSPLIVGMRCSVTDLKRYGYEYRKDYRSVLIWHECPDCKIQYWRENRKQSIYCEGCTVKHNGLKTVGSNSGLWTGGKHRTPQGYWNIRISKDDPYYCMARKDGRCFEHKYLYAKYLGRPLERWEVVHHKGTQYPEGSFEDCGDNRIENLELCSKQANHLVYNLMSKEIKELRARVTLIEAELALYQAQYGALNNVTT